jgi:ABC-type lipoprotein export system ATPase subunit
MGPSGAGKSSFLSIITQKKQSFSNKLTTRGDVTNYLKIDFS